MWPWINSQALFSLLNQWFLVKHLKVLEVFLNDVQAGWLIKVTNVPVTIIWTGEEDQRRGERDLPFMSMQRENWVYTIFQFYVIVDQIFLVSTLFAPVSWPPVHTVLPLCGTYPTGDVWREHLTTYFLLAKHGCNLTTHNPWYFRGMKRFAWCCCISNRSFHLFIFLWEQWTFFSQFYLYEHPLQGFPSMFSFIFCILLFCLSSQTDFTDSLLLHSELALWVSSWF